jgi:hypothetical protein
VKHPIGDAADDIYDRDAFTGVIANLVANSLSASGAGGFPAEGVMRLAPVCVINLSMPHTVTFASFDTSIASISGHVKNPNLVKENIIKRIDGLSEDQDLYEDGELPPSAFTKEDARNIILGLYPSGSLAGADVYPYFGSIHINWETSSKKVKLIVPPHDTNRHPSIYHGQMHKGKVTKSDIESDATSQLLRRWLEWLLG